MAGTNRLLNACKKSDSALLASLLDEGLFDVRRKDFNGETALHYCAKNQNPTCAELLLKANPDVSLIQDHSGFTALHLGITRRNHMFVERHLELNTLPLDVADLSKHPPIYWAIISGDLRMFKILLSHRPRLNDVDNNGATVLHHACRVCGTSGFREVGSEMIDCLIREGANVNAKDVEGRTPFMWAACIGSVTACEQLLNHAADMKIRNRSGLLPIHCATSLGNSEVVEFLVDRYPGLIEVDDYHGCSPIFYAVTMKQSSTASVLLVHGANAHRVDKKGRNLVHCAAIKDSVELIDKLIESNVRLWSKSDDGQSPLHLACNYASPEFVESLLKAERTQEDIDLRNDRGQSALHIACMRGNAGIIQHLLDADANANLVLKRKRGPPATALDLTINEECRRLLKGHRGAKSAFQLLRNKKLSSRRKTAVGLRGSRFSSRTTSQASLQSKRTSSRSTPVTDGVVTTDAQMNPEEQIPETTEPEDGSQGEIEHSAHNFRDAASENDLTVEDEERLDESMTGTKYQYPLTKESILEEDEDGEEKEEEEEDPDDDASQIDDDVSLGIIDDEGDGESLTGSLGSALDEFGSEYSWADLELQYELDKKIFGDEESVASDDVESVVSDDTVIDLEKEGDEGENVTPVEANEETEGNTEETKEPKESKPPKKQVRKASPKATRKKLTRRKVSPESWYRNPREAKPRRRKSPNPTVSKSSPSHVRKVRDSVQTFNYIREEVAYIKDFYRRKAKSQNAVLPVAPFRRITVDEFYKNHPISFGPEKMTERKENHDNNLKRLNIMASRRTPSPLISTKTNSDTSHNNSDSSFRNHRNTSKATRPKSAYVFSQKSHSAFFRPKIDLTFAGASRRPNSAYGH